MSPPGLLMMYFIIWPVCISNILTSSKSQKNVMIKQFIHKNESLSKRSLSAQYVESVNSKRIWWLLTLDQGVFMSIQINYSLISNMIHLLQKFQFRDISKMTIEFQSNSSGTRKLKKSMQRKLRKQKRRAKRRKRLTMMTKRRKKNQLDSMQKLN